MSAFNKARFNLARYNVEVSGAVWMTGSAAASFTFKFAGQTFYCYGNSNVSFISGDMRLDTGRFTSGSAVETFDQASDVLGYFKLTAGAAETIDMETLNLSQIAMLTAAAEETAAAESNLSQIVNANGSVSETLDIEKCSLSQIIFDAADGGEVFVATVDIVAQTEYTCEFPGLTLKPGQTLVIDASTFNVLLDNQNAIYLQKGDWLDDLNRNTQSIIITGTGASRLTAEILYTERYL